MYKRQVLLCIEEHIIITNVIYSFHSMQFVMCNSTYLEYICNTKNVICDIIYLIIARLRKEEII